MRGFSFIEIVVVMSVMLGVIMLALISFLRTRTSEDVLTSGQSGIALLRNAQSRARAGEDGAPWGVRLDQNQMSMFRGSVFASSSIVHALPFSSARLTNVALNEGGKDIVFQNVAGTTTQSGTFDIAGKNDPTQVFSISVDSAGNAYRAGTSTLMLDTRIRDLRHRAFTLGWSIQGASTLAFTFYDPGFVTSVVMAPYFTGGGTGFDWSGAIIVDGEEQTLRIHTSLLTASDTTLLIDRDCRQNTKKLSVAIDGKTIATYEADCKTITIGAFGGIMSEP